MLWCRETKRAIMIITSLLDTDLYKFSMMQVVLHHFPAAQVEYRYKCRTKGVDLRPYMDVRNKRFRPPFPASTLVIVSGFARPEFVVEVEVVAAGPASEA